MQRSLGVLIGFAAGLATFLAIVSLDDVERAAGSQRLLFIVAGLVLTGMFSLLGLLLGAFFSSRPVPAQKRRDVRPTPNVDESEPFVVAEAVEESRWLAFGSGVAKWSWILGLVGILLTVICGLNLTTSPSAIPLLVAVPFFILGVVCTTIGIVTAFFRITTPLVAHVALGTITNFVCLLLITVCGFMLLVHHLAEEARAQRLADSSRNTRQQRASDPMRLPPHLRQRNQRSSKPATLQDAVASGQLDAVQKYIDAGAKLNAVYRDGQTLLIRATSRRLTDMAKLLLENGADVNGNPEKGLMPLNIALQQRNEPLAALLLQYKPQINDADKQGYTALQLAVLAGYVEIVEELLERDAYIHAVAGSRGTPLKMAVDTSSIEITRLLLEKGAKPNAGDKNRGSMLHVAITRDNSNLAKLLISHGADVNAHSRRVASPLHEAISRYNTELVKLLLEKGADPNVGTYNESPMTAALRYKSPEIVALLADAGATHKLSGPNDRILYAIIESDKEELHRQVLEDGKRLFGFDPKPNLLFAASKSGNKDFIQTLLDAGADPTHKYLGQESLLAVAVRSKNLPTVDLLLEAGTPIRSNLPLIVAAQIGSLEIAALLIEHGTDVNAYDSKHRTSPLLAAVFKNNVAVARLLLENGANANAQGSQTSPLAAALHNRSAEMVLLLADHGATTKLRVPVDSNLSTIMGSRDAELQRVVVQNCDRLFGANAKAQLLHSAARSRNTSVVQTLLDAGADASHSYKGLPSLVTSAVQSRHEPMVTLLLEAGAPIESSAELSAAISVGSLDLMKLLIDHKADVNAESLGTTPLLTAADRNNEAAIELLLANGADVNLATSRMASPLVHAAMNNRVDAFNAIIEHGANVESVDANGWTALHHAARRRNLDFATALIRRGADVNARDKVGQTPLIIALQRGLEQKQFVVFLLDHKADTNVTLKPSSSYNAATPLHVAARERVGSEIIELLVDAGGDVNARNSEGQTPLHIATRFSDEATVRLLLARGADRSLKAKNGYTPHDTARRYRRNLDVFETSTTPNAKPRK